MRNIFTQKISIFFLFFISFCFFTFILDIKILNPKNTNWLIEGDGALHYLGWQFFRYTPILQWPMGLNPEYGIDFVSSSIIYSDSVPLVAFLFKFINSWLPENFQYSGMWLLFCFFMQSFISWKILSKFTNNKLLPIIGSTFFVIAPVFLFRIQFHYALSAHWIILYSIYLYFENRNVFKSWVLLLSISILTMPYLFAMITPIWLAHLFKIKRLYLLTNIFLLKNLIYIFGILYIVALISGYFVILNGTGGSGFGFFKANLLTFFDPLIFTENNWSQIIPDIKNGGGEYEGMAFLGIGIIFLMLISLIVCIKNLSIIKGFYFKSLLPISIALFILFLYSISNKISFGSFELIEIVLPSFVDNMVSKLRTGGRFIWPVYYCIYIATLFMIFRFLRPKFSIPILLFALFFQLYDSKKIFNQISNKFSNLLLIETPMKSKLWDEFSKLYDQVIFVTLPRSGYVGWMPISEYAAHNRMGTNAAHLGRTDYSKMSIFNSRLEKSIINNNLRDKSLYIFQDDKLWNVVRSRATKNDLVGTLDGFRFFAPYYLNCDQCKKEFSEILSDNDNLIFEYNMQKIDFTSSTKNNPYKIYGWDTPQKDGTWTIEKEAYIYLKLINNDKKNINLEIEASIFSPNVINSQNVMVYINDFFIGSVRFSNEHEFAKKSIEIPSSALSQSNNNILINLVFNDAESPKNLNLHNDSRPHALKVKNVKLNWIN